MKYIYILKNFNYFLLLLFSATSPRFSDLKSANKSAEVTGKGMRSKLKSLVAGKSSKTLKDVSAFDRINTDDLSLCSNLDLWLGDHLKKGFHWDVIQFNHGLHDLKQPFTQVFFPAGLSDTVTIQ